MLRLIFLIAGAGFASDHLYAQAKPAPNETNRSSPSESSEPSEPVFQPFLSRLNGLFGGDLPQLDPPGTFKLIFHPHFGDLIHRDYMRVDTGLRWALNDTFELTGAADFYFTHGLGGSTADGYGVGRLRFGSKYVFERWPRPNYETSLGLNIELPVGQAPIDMTDGQNHVMPTVVVQHDWATVRHLTTYAGLGFDFLGQSSVAGTFGTNQPHDDSVSFTAGALYDVGQLKWTFSGTYATTAVISNRDKNFYYLQPGILWYVPRRFTFNSKTQWILGLSVRASFGPDGTDISLGSRVRAEITFRQVMDKMRLKSK